MKRMNELERRICSAWRRASEDLGVQFSAPFAVMTPSGQSYAYLGLVHDFGRSRGTLICMIEGDCPKLPVDLEGEYGVSLLGDSYAVYERQLFEPTLSDWGWCGPADQRPSWLTGQPWTEEVTGE